MSPSRRSISIIVFAALLLILYLAAHIARAQDAAPEVPTEIVVVTSVPTEAPPQEDAGVVTITAAPMLAEPTAIWVEPTAVWLEPTGVVAPTENPPVEETVVEENAVTTPLLTELPPSDEAMTDPLVTPTLSEPTILPTDDPLLTLVPTDEPTIQAPAANITIAGSMTRSLENNRLTLTVAAEGFAEVYDVSVACRVDPTLLQGVQATSGDWLLTNQSTVTDSGFQADGLWILLGKQVDSQPQAASVGTLWTLDYQVVGTGAAEIVCLTQASDQHNQPISLANFNPVLNIEISNISDEVSVTPTVAPEPTITASITEIFPATPMFVPTEISEERWVHVYGRVESRLPLTNATITITGGATNQVIAVQPNGAYGFDLPAGEYQFTFDALYSLQVALPVVLTGEPIKLPIVTLTGGDVDGNRVVDTMDAMLISQNFGLFAHLASAAVDLNEDGIVNIYDLALVSASIPR